MSFPAISWVMDFSNSRLSDRLVINCLAYHLNADSQLTYPGISLIAEECNLSEQQVHNSIDSLLNTLHEIEVVGEGGGRGKKTVYRIPAFDEWVKTALPKTANRLTPLLERVNSVRETLKTVRERVNSVHSENCPKVYENNGVGLDKQAEQSFEPKENLNTKSGPVSGFEKQEPTDSFAIARREYRRIVGKSFGSLGHSRGQWDTLIEKSGLDTVISAVRIFATDKRDWLKREVDWPVGMFLKNAREFIEYAQDEKNKVLEPEVPMDVWEKLRLKNEAEDRARGRK